MSAAYCKELLLDLSVNKVPLDVRADLLVSIQELHQSRVLSYSDIYILNHYLAGYTTQEIAVKIGNYSNKVEDTLDRIITAIATDSGYTDQIILQRVQMSKQSKARKEKAKEVLERISDEY